MKDQQLQEAQWLMAHELAQELLSQDQEAGKDPEHRRYLLHDFNDMLNQAGVGVGGEVGPSALDGNPLLLEGNLRESLEWPVARLAKELPNHLARFMKRPDAATARFLLEQISLQADDYA